ncbi:MAG TPA: 3D domain-containing protein [Pyrinomonadaceae bacterium]|nr:3D domain-containing protein [Pyrinomonadaceae bacterium]
MKNLVRGGLLSALLSLFVVIIYAQTQPKENFNLANNSQLQLNSIEVSNTKKEVSNTSNKETTKETAKDITDDKVKKLVKETSLVTAAKAGMNKGSFSATAYCLSGRTAMGSGVRRGIIAADPRVLRLGSKVMITGGGYSGTYTVTDTGGGIKGRELDIWVPSCSEARRFGRRPVNVTLLPN